ncbi:DNA sulfur modification protein DndD [Kineococcus terrestris]|uniref:DNA sulfur modification protein DndD n=1 Tax=Kineococcus terrestris TaxID=2044856 RepID=UPI0034DAD850
MQLTELILHNYGVYRGRQVVDLRTKPGQPVILVGGLNGGGKTTFLDSLQLALYGNRARLSNRGKMGWEDFLRASINRDVSAEQGASISLTFTIDVEGSERTYRVVRTWSAAGKSIREFVNVFVDGKINPALSATWADHVEELLPLDIASLFFFDAEKIESLADPDTAATVVETAVHSLLGVGTLDQLRTDLLALQRRQTPPSGDAELDRQAGHLQAQIERLQVAEELDAQRAASAGNETATARRHLEQASRAFEKAGGVLFEKRARLEAERTAAARALDEARDQLRELTEGALPLALLRPQLADLQVTAEAEEAARRNAQLVEELQQRDAWLLEQLSAAAAKKLAATLAADRQKRLDEASASPVLGLDASTRQLLSSLPAVLDREQASATALRESSAAAQEQLAHLDAQLAGVPADDVIAALLKARDDARLQVARAEEREAVIAEGRQTRRGELEALHVELRKVEVARREHAVKSQDVQRILQHTDRVRRTLVELKQRLIAKHINKIEVATLTSFSQLMRKTGLVQDLRIDGKTFAVTLIDRNGDDLPAGRLSAGERQLLAVALLWGLAKVAGHRLPAVIDTPLGRLDSQHRRHLVDRYFPAAGAQVLLLSTDEEIDEPLLRLLAPSIARAYVLDHDDQQHQTTVRPGYWWPLETSDVA